MSKTYRSSLVFLILTLLSLPALAQSQRGQVIDCRFLAKLTPEVSRRELVSLYRNQRKTTFFVLDKRYAYRCDQCLDDARLGGTGDGPRLNGTGDDARLGGTGDDARLGGTGDDARLDGTGDDARLGGTGDDARLGGTGDDARLGGTGDDARLGGTGDDARLGGTGDDARLGGTGDDARLGGTGDDSRLGAGKDNPRLQGLKFALACKVNKAQGNMLLNPRSLDLDFFDGNTLTQY